MSNRDAVQFEDPSQELDTLARHDDMIFRIVCMVLTLLFVLSAIFGASLASKEAAPTSEHEVR